PSQVGLGDDCVYALVGHCEVHPEQVELGGAQVDVLGRSRGDPSLHDAEILFGLGDHRTGGIEVAQGALEVDDAAFDVHLDGAPLPVLVGPGLGGGERLRLYVVEGGRQAAYVVAQHEAYGPGAREERGIGLEGDALVGIGQSIAAGDRHRGVEGGAR